MKCIWCSMEVKKKGSRQIPYWYKHWRKGSMHASCFREYESLHNYSVPQAVRSDGHYDFWYAPRKDYEFTLSAVRDAFEWLDRGGS